MPAWQPTWTDVRFDHAAARRAVDELERAAALLAAQRPARVGLAEAATREWRGRHRAAFDAGERHRRVEAARLEAALTAAARAIEAAAPRPPPGGMGHETTAQVVS